MKASEAPLTPLAFLERSAAVWSERTAVRYGDRVWTFAEHYERVRCLAGALIDDLGLRPGERVATLLPNVPAMLELHYAVPAAGGVLVPLNVRLAATEYEYILRHSEATILIAWPKLRPVVEAVLTRLGSTAPRVVFTDELAAMSGPPRYQRPDDERSLLSINYTSGTTGTPKGVMTSHRGAYLHSLGVLTEAALTPRSVYLWTLPMFHCNGWAYTWAVTAAGAAHICLEQVDTTEVWKELSDGGVTHLCAAPTVVTMILEATASTRCDHPVRLFIGGSPPSPALLQQAEALNIDVTHLYGLTETYGPLAICAWNPDWDACSPEQQATLRARQGVATVVTEQLRVVDEAMRDVPADGETIGEIVMRGNNVTLGYYRDPDATAAAFAGGWFHSGDLAVMHPDGYLEIRDRSKDIVISGGENISTVEVEQVLAAFEGIVEAAVVGTPDDRWGEVPVAFVTVRPGATVDVEALQSFARERLARFKVPKRIELVDDLPRTATGKIQKYILRESLRQPLD